MEAIISLRRIGKVFKVFFLNLFWNEIELQSHEIEKEQNFWTSSQIIEIVTGARWIKKSIGPSLMLVFITAAPSGGNEMNVSCWSSVHDLLYK